MNPVAITADVPASERKELEFVMKKEEAGNLKTYLIELLKVHFRSFIKTLCYLTGYVKDPKNY